MTSSPKRPYFVRAMHEWLTDNGYTPYLMVDTNTKNLLAPTEYAQDGRLVLAISYQATNNLLITNDDISFQARFGGVSKDVWIPMQAVIGIYAKETLNTVYFLTQQNMMVMNLPRLPAKMMTLMTSHPKAVI